MDIYKLKFTRLQDEILNFLFLKTGASFNGRSLARHLKVSPTAIMKSLPLLEKEELIDVKKDKETKNLTIKLNLDNPRITNMKRVNNLKQIYESKLSDFLTDTFPSATIILFGSYSYGEDTINSDIDIAIIGYKSRELELKNYEKILERKININYYQNLLQIDKNLKENLFNGIILKGGINL